MSGDKRGPIVTVRVTDDGTPICPHCGQVTVTDDDGQTWQCPDMKVINDAITRDLAAAFDRLYSEPMQPRQRLLSARCGIYGSHGRCHSAICECDCHIAPLTAEDQA